MWGWVRRISNSTYFEGIWISTNLANWNPSKKMLAFEMLFNFSIQTKHFITKKSKFFKIKMNCFIKILYQNTPLMLIFIIKTISCASGGVYCVFIWLPNIIQFILFYFEELNWEFSLDFVINPTPARQLTTYFLLILLLQTFRPSWSVVFGSSLDLLLLSMDHWCLVHLQQWSV